MTDDLVKEALIGDEARRFVESELGKAMLDLADKQLRASQEALETVDPSQTEKIRSLQNKAQIARNFGEWLVELIDMGEKALIIYKQQRDEDALSEW